MWTKSYRCNGSNSRQSDDHEHASVPLVSSLKEEVNFELRCYRHCIMGKMWDISSHKTGAQW